QPPPASPPLPYTTLFRSKQLQIRVVTAPPAPSSTARIEDCFAPARTRDSGEALLRRLQLLSSIPQAGSRQRRCYSTHPHSRAVRSEEHTSELQSLRHLVC